MAVEGPAQLLWSHVVKSVMLEQGPDVGGVLVQKFAAFYTDATFLKFYGNSNEVHLPLCFVPLANCRQHASELADPAGCRAPSGCSLTVLRYPRLLRFSFCAKVRTRACI